MEPRAFCSQSNVVIVAGKGGVGKTTVAAALAVTAARAGLSTLLVDVESTGSLAALFGRPGRLGYEPTVLSPTRRARAEITGRSISADDALVEYLDGHGLRRISKRMATTGTLELVATAVPGIKDVLVLGKIKQLEQADPAPELIVVDAPAAGHAVAFLATPRGMLDAIGVGPIRTQSADALALLTDPSRCQVLLVTLPEETPVNEVVETAYHLEDRAGVKLAPVVVNGLLTPLELPEDAAAAATEAGAHLDRDAAEALGAAAAFRRRRQQLQEAQVERLAGELPLPQLHLPLLWASALGPAELESLADSLERALGLLPGGHLGGNGPAGGAVADLSSTGRSLPGPGRA